MHQVAIAHRTIDTALVIRDIIDLHDVSIRGYGQATFTAQYVVCHSGNQPRKLFTRKHVHFGRSPGFDFTVGTEELSQIETHVIHIIPRDSLLIKTLISAKVKCRDGLIQ